MALLGLLYRKSPAPLHNVTRAMLYYNAALELLPSHCVAAAYLAELHVDAGDFELAAAAAATLTTIAQAQGGVSCRQVQEALHSRWSMAGWCARGALARGYVALSGSPCPTPPEVTPVASGARATSSLRRAGRRGEWASSMLVSGSLSVLLAVPVRLCF